MAKHKSELAATIVARVKEGWEDLTNMERIGRVRAALDDVVYSRPLGMLTDDDVTWIADRVIQQR